MVGPLRILRSRRIDEEPRRRKLLRMMPPDLPLGNSSRSDPIVRISARGKAGRKISPLSEPPL